MRKPIISVIIGMSLMTNVFASPGAQETPMNLDAEAAVFSVTVPSTMQIHVDEDGVVTTPSVVSIINNSSAPVKVNNVEITPSDLSEWSIVDFNTDMNREKIGSKKVGIQINGCETDSLGEFQFDPLSFPSIAGKESMVLTYDAVVPTQETVIADTDIAKIVFTIGWDIADGSESGGGDTGGTIPTDPVDPEVPDPVDPGIEEPEIDPEQEAINASFTFMPRTGAPNSYGGVQGYFKYTGTDTTVTIPTEINGYTLRDTYYMFRDTNVKKVINTNPKITNMSLMFFNSLATTLDLSELDTSKVTSMSQMFQSSQATKLDLSNFNTSNVTTVERMFEKSKVNTLDLSSFDTSNVTDMSNMFFGAPAAPLDLSSFDTSKVTDVNSMFSGSQVTTGYARTQSDADKFNNSSGKPYGLTFTVK